jgi:hypothetical protein
VTDDTKQQDPKQATPGRSSAFLPFKLLGWITGALSIVNLTKDLNWFTLEGNIARWVNTYQRLVGDARTFLFGWIHVSWMHVSIADAHGLVLCALIGSSVLRGLIAGDRAPAETRAERFGEAIGMGLLAWLAPMLIVSLLALVLPDPWGFWVPIGLMGAIVALFGQNSPTFRARGFWYGFGLNLIAVTGCVLIVILVGTFLK